MEKTIHKFIRKRVERAHKFNKRQVPIVSKNAPTLPVRSGLKHEVYFLQQ